MGVFDYDLVVIGSGPAGHSAAVQAARLRKSVALVERNESVGGVCVNTGTIPSKTMREALIYLSGYREHLTYGAREARRSCRAIRTPEPARRSGSLPRSTPSSRS